jgi:hypothetical protein
MAFRTEVARSTRSIAAPIALAILLALTNGIYAQTASSLPDVLQVGTSEGVDGVYKTIQDAVNAARPGDWILIAPGTYHEMGSNIAGVLITTPGIHLRGMDRNGVVVDGTNPNPATCSSNPADQNTGVNGAGRNGIEVFKVDGVTIENLTVCNFLGDLMGNNGNQIWWNGGDGSGKIGIGSYSGSYLTASSTFYQQGTPISMQQLAQYGIFASNAKGPGSISYSYVSNMSDSGFYIGACHDCNAVLNFVHAQNNPQGFSGSNAGGHLVIENSEWDLNQAGIVPSSLAVYDPPSPQNGACPHESGVSCTLIQGNYVHDNNNPNTPAVGLAAIVPVGTGIELSGGINNTVQNNSVVHNGAWGILLNDFADYSPPHFPHTYCQGGTQNYIPVSPYDQLYSPPYAPPMSIPIPCYFNSSGNTILNNTFLSNGFFGNDTNGDVANAALPYSLNNCFRNNVNLRFGAPSTSPTNLPTACGQLWNPDTQQEHSLTLQLGCDSLGPASGACTGLTGHPYPLQTHVKLLPIPKLDDMSNPCAGVPTNS